MDIVCLTQKPLNEIADIWQKLESSIQPTSLSCRWNWVETWLKTFASTVPYEFFCARDIRGIQGICLITKQTGRFLPFPVNCYQLGTAGEPIKDRIMMINNQLLVYPDKLKQFISLLLKKIILHSSWEEFRLDFFCKSDIDAFIQALNREKAAYKVINESASYFDLKTARTGTGKIMDVFHKKVRQCLKQTMKGLGGNLTTTYADTIEDARDIFNEMIQLHQNSWERRGKRGMFASRLFTAFHREIIEKLFPLGQIMLFRVKNELGTVGCLYGFIENKTLLGYQGGFADVGGISNLQINSKRIKAGMICHLLCMQACVERGLDEYNFGPAEYFYKREMSTGTKHTWSLSIRKSISPYVRDLVWNIYVKADTNKTTHILLQPFYATYKYLT